MNRGSRFFRFSFQQIYPDHRRLDLALASLSELQRRHRHCNMNLNPGQNPLSRLGLGSLTALSDALQDLLTVLVEVELGDDDLGGVDTEGNALAVGLLADDTLDVDNPLKTVNAGDLALTALLASTDNGDLVVLTDGERADLSTTASELCSLYSCFIPSFMSLVLLSSRLHLRFSGLSEPNPD